MILKENIRVLPQPRCGRDFHIGCPCGEQGEVFKIGLEHAAVTHHTHLQRFLGRLMGKQAEVKGALGAAGIFPAGGSVVMHLIGAGNDTINRVAAKGADAFGFGVEPPIHQIKVVAVFVDETAAAFAPVLNPFTALGLEWAAEFLAPRHLGCAYGPAVDQLFNLCKVGRITQLMSYH